MNQGAPQAPLGRGFGTAAVVKKTRSMFRQRQTKIQHRRAMPYDLHQFLAPSSPPIDEPPAGPDNVPVREPNPIESPDVPVREPDPAEPNQI